MYSDERIKYIHICQLLMSYASGQWKSELVSLVEHHTPYSLEEVKFQYLALIYEGWLFERQGKVFTK